MLINQKFFSLCKLYTHRPFMVELDNNLHLVKKTGVKPFAAAPENAKAKIFTTGSNCKALKKCNTKVVYLSKISYSTASTTILNLSSHLPLYNSHYFKKITIASQSIAYAAIPNVAVKGKGRLNPYILSGYGPNYSVLAKYTDAVNNTGLQPESVTVKTSATSLDQDQLNLTNHGVLLSRLGARELFFTEFKNNKPLKKKLFFAIGPTGRKYYLGPEGYKMKKK